MVRWTSVPSCSQSIVILIASAQGISQQFRADISVKKLVSAITPATSRNSHRANQPRITLADPNSIIVPEDRLGRGTSASRRASTMDASWRSAKVWFTWFVLPFYMLSYSFCLHFSGHSRVTHAAQEQECEPQCPGRPGGGSSSLGRGIAASSYRDWGSQTKMANGC